jgi:hypothetical protein
LLRAENVIDALMSASLKANFAKYASDSAKDDFASALASFAIAIVSFAIVLASLTIAIAKAKSPPAGSSIADAGAYFVISALKLSPLESYISIAFLNPS